MTDYNPRDALKILKANNAMPARKPVGPHVPDPYQMKSRPLPLCFPLAAFIDKAKALPEDILAIPVGRGELQKHRRPDGGTFIGLFELPDQPASGIVVFGDPLMSRDNAIAVSIAFRRRLQRIVDDQMAQDNAAIESSEFAGKPQTEQ